MRIPFNELNTKARQSGLFFDLSSQYALINLIGSDAISFLQALTTNNLKELKSGVYQFHCILDRKGQVIFGFYVKSLNDSDLQILCAKKDQKPLIEKLDMFLFAEDLNISENDSPITLHYGPDSVNNSEGTEIKWGVEPSCIISSAVETVDLIKVDSEEIINYIHSFQILGGVVPLGSYENHLFTDFNYTTPYFSETKGCYPGQEIVTRIMQRGKSPNKLISFESQSTKLQSGLKLLNQESKKKGVILSHSLTFNNDDKQVSIGLALVSQNNTENELTIEGSKDQLVLKESPLASSEFLKSKIKTGYDLGIGYYHSSEYDKAQIELNKVLDLDNKHADSYEALAMVEEKLGNLDKAINLNKTYSQVSPSSVMSYTNLSRLYMLKGWIEKAEEEQQKAQDVYFKNQNSNKPTTKISSDAIAEQNEKLKAERLRKMNIFKQVLDMDADDEIAHFGLGKIYVDTKEFSMALPHLELLLKNNPIYSAAYPLLGKAYFELEKMDECKNLIETGIKITKDKGDLMPMKQLEILSKKFK